MPLRHDYALDFRQLYADADDAAFIRLRHAAIRYAAMPLLRVDRAIWREQC